MKYPKKTKFLDNEQFLLLYRQFLHDCDQGIRLQKNGKRVSPKTVLRYGYLFKLLEEFDKNDFELKLFFVPNLTTRELEGAKKYWKKFYYAFIDFMYKKGCYDNYVGGTIKVLRTYFNYLINEKQLPIGMFHKNFYCPKDEIPVIVLSPEQLASFINDTALLERLPDDLQTVRDIFVFGCTVGLRVSDLMALKPYNLVKQREEYYLKVRSKKTYVDTVIKLPSYAIEILQKYQPQTLKGRNKQTTLLPSMSTWYFNKQLKRLARYLTSDEPLIKVRQKKGIQTVVYKNREKKQHYTMADHISSHTMRRTAITTMLSLGMAEQLVRRISGHSPNSSEFYKYVAYSQNLLDTETEKVFEKLVALSTELHKY